jgi:ribosomal protein L16/L10AE
MLQPARRKYRKEQKGRNTGVATRGAKASFCAFDLQATEPREARWPHLDPHLPGQAHLAKAG